ncbi:PREDICTED: uncharacterized protein LOC107070642 [Polistes dominula]|uniref:Uncharacterized protein LOC107070642 n=1 Tax=Polistes dominula TaxID=743375 RepID=A0ABM1IWD2_POLDO|nr:PREDICTED: uncharacterized protein LOC107070642 [Polistes dominula]
MKIKSVYLLMCIKFLLVLSTIADKKEIVVKFEKAPFKIDPFTNALLKIQSYENLCRKLFLNRQENHDKFLQRFDEEDNYYNKLIIIIDFIEHLVKDIENSVTLLDNTKSYFMKSNGSLARGNSILETLYLVSKQISIFEKFIRDLSNVETRDALFPDKLNEMIVLPLLYTNLMKDTVDENIIDTLVSIKNRLIETRFTMQLNKLNVDRNTMKSEL